MRVVGLDIHRAFAEAVAWDDGKLKRLGRVDMRRHLLGAFAMKLSKEDVVVVEATGDAASVAAVIAPHFTGASTSRSCAGTGRPRGSRTARQKREIGREGMSSHSLARTLMDEKAA